MYLFMLSKLVLGQAVPTLQSKAASTAPLSQAAQPLSLEDVSPQWLSTHHLQDLPDEGGQSMRKLEWCTCSSAVMCVLSTPLVSSSV
jgi:hypothetical protein